MKIVGIIALFITLFIFPYFLCNGESKNLDATARREAKGEFVPLGKGMVHYEIAGTEHANPTILIHGFSVPFVIWDKTFPALVENGFQVVRYDLFGRGYSDRPDVTYDINLFESQLLELLETLKITEKVNLVGVSMGGLIAVHYANKFPEKVNKVVLIDPAGFPMNLSITSYLVILPILGEYIINVFGDTIFMSGLSANFNNPQIRYEIKETFQKQMNFYGFKQALLSTLRNMPLENFISIYEKYGKKNIPTLLFWATDDKVIPYKNYARIISLIPHTKFITIEKGGHTPQYENPELVNPVLIDFLRGH